MKRFSVRQEHHRSARLPISGTRPHRRIIPSSCTASRMGFVITRSIHSSKITFRSGLVLTALKYSVVFTQLERSPCSFPMTSMPQASRTSLRFPISLIPGEIIFRQDCRDLGVTRVVADNNTLSAPFSEERRLSERLPCHVLIATAAIALTVSLICAQKTGLVRPKRPSNHPCNAEYAPKGICERSFVGVASEPA
jgi:hypothetical protein